jgi:chromate reductase
MKILFIPGSLRKESFNFKLLEMAVNHLGYDTSSIISAEEMNLPLYSGDIESSGIPESVQKLAIKVKQADAIIIASPEYNYSISGVLKNFIDWVSRVRPMPLTAKPILLMAASPSNIQGIRGLWHARVPLEGLGNYVHPKMFSVGDCFNEFEGNKFKQDSLNEQFVATLNDFIDYSKRLS